MFCTVTCIYFHNFYFIQSQFLFFLINPECFVPKLLLSLSVYSVFFICQHGFLSLKPHQHFFSPYSPSLHIPHRIFSFCFSNQTKGSEKSEKATFSTSLCLLNCRKGYPGEKKKRKLNMKNTPRPDYGKQIAPTRPPSRHWMLHVSVSLFFLCCVLFCFLFPSCGVALQLSWATSECFSLKDVNIRRTNRKGRKKTKQTKKKKPHRDGAKVVAKRT